MRQEPDTWMPETGSPCLELDLPEAAVQLVKFVDLTDEKVTVATRHLYKINIRKVLIQ